MARIVSTTSTYGAPTRAATLKALQERQEALQRQQAQAAANQQPIADPWQGAAQLANAFVNARQQSHAATQEAEGRQRLAEAMGGWSQTGEATPQQMATMMELDPEQGMRIAADMVRQRRDLAAMKEQRAYEAGQVASNRAYQEGRAAEQRTYEEQQAAKATAAATATEAAKDQRELAQQIETEKRAEERAVAADERKAAAEAAKVKTEGAGFKAEQDLRKEYNALPEIKALPTIENAYERIDVGANTNSPVGDMALIYGFMKLQDPESVVREGEYATAENARGAGDTVRNLYNRIVAGERLTPEQRQQFTGQAYDQLAIYQGQVDAANQRYSAIATNAGMDPTRVLRQPKRYERRKATAAEQPPAAAPAAETGGGLGAMFSSGGAVGSGMAAPAAAAEAPILLKEGKTAAGLDVKQTLDDARAAIPRKGRAAVEKLLRESGIDPGAL